MQKQNKNFAPLVISGCSGVGKGTLIKHLLSTYPKLFALSVSCTTRGPRVGQEDGRQYYFITKQQFQKQIEKDAFAEYCHVHGNIYGTLKAKLNQAIQKGIICVLDIDIQGGQKIHKNFEKQCNYLFIDAPSMEQLQKRLRGRGTQNQQAIQKRMNNAKGQLQTVNGLQIYQRIKNEDLQVSKKKLEQYIEKQYNIALKNYQ